MAYDRYDSHDQNRGTRGERGREPPRGSDENRGFFDRARDEVTSWFGDEESGGRRHRDERMEHPDSSRRSESREQQRRGYEPQAYDQPESIRSDRDGDRSALFSGGQSSNYGRGRDEGDARNQYGRGGGEYTPQNRPQPSSYGHDREQDRSSSGFQSQGSERYRPLTGDYGRGSGMGGQDYGQQQYGRQDRFQDQGRDAGRSVLPAAGLASNSGKSPHDEHYSSWRQRQIEDLDRDYDEYCREHQSRFENEFSGFRTQRQTKRQMLQSIREHFEVVDEGGQHIGTVDKVRGDKIILTKNDPEARGVHRSFTCTLLDRIEDNKVYLAGSKDSIRSRLTEEREEHRGDDDRSSGGRILGSLFGSSDNDRRDEQRQPQQSTNQPVGQSPSSTSPSPTSTTGTSEGPHILDQSFSGTYDDDSSSAPKRK